VDASLLALLAHCLEILVCGRIQVTVDINESHACFLLGEVCEIAQGSRHDQQYINQVKILHR
jgi:hypothetical protein